MSQGVALISHNKSYCCGCTWFKMKPLYVILILISIIWYILSVCIIIFVHQQLPSSRQITISAKGSGEVAVTVSDWRKSNKSKLKTENVPIHQTLENSFLLGRLWLSTMQNRKRGVTPARTLSLIWLLKGMIKVRFVCLQFSERDMIINTIYLKM